MAPGNVEIVRRLYKEFNRGGEGWLELCDPAVELHMARNWTEEPVYRGREGLMVAVGLMTASFSEYRWEPEALVARDERVAGLFRMRGRMRDGGGWLEQPAYAVFEVDGGLVRRVQLHSSWREALDDT
jgi:ketosteroid isomerase-like protein